MDIIECVHEEMRIDLVLQVGKFHFESLLFQTFHPVVVANGLEQELDRHVYSDDQDDD